MQDPLEVVFVKMKAHYLDLGVSEYQSLYGASFCTAIEVVLDT